MHDLDSFPTSLARYLRQFAARRKTFILLRALGVAVACWFCWLLVMCFVDRFAALPHNIRLVSFFLGASFTGLSFAWFAWGAIQSRSWNLVAARIESRTQLFNEQLQTITSYLLVPRPDKVSYPMLRQTLSRVQELLPRAPVDQLLPLRMVFGPWLSVAVIALVLASLSWFPNLQLHQLMARALHPRRAIDPVSMTQLTIAPRQAEVSQGGMVTVTATMRGPRALRDASHVAELYLSADRRNWSHAAMKPLAITPQESSFEFAIPAIDRDLDFYVRGGDAQSEVCRIKVQRVPTMSEFQIRYDYPDYANHPTARVINADGRIEGLAGSTATVTIVVSEPLQSARWILDGQPLTMQATDLPDRWTVTLPVAVSGSCAVEMTSLDGVMGRGPAPMELRAVRDEPPQATVAQPTFDWQVNPTDLAIINVAASDDFGLAAMDVEISLAGQIVSRNSVPLTDRPIRRDAEIALQPAALGANVGDLLTLIVRVQDTDGQSTSSDERRIIVCPSTISPRWMEQYAELRRAGQLAGVWGDSLSKSLTALELAKSATSSTKPDADLGQRTNRAVNAVADAGEALRQSLLRALVRSDSSDDNLALSSWANDTEVPLAETGRTFSTNPRGIGGLSNRLQAVVAKAKEDTANVTLLRQALHARIALQMLASLQSILALPPPTNQLAAARNDAVERLRQSLAGWLAKEGLTESAQLSSLLQQRVLAGSAVVAALRSPDWIAQAQDWAGHFTKQSGAPISEFPAKLALMAQMQAIQPDGNFIQSRDMLLAARAAMALASSSGAAREIETAATRKRTVTPLEEFSRAITALASGPALTDSAHRAAADAAREQLRALASNLGASTSSGDLFDTPSLWAIEAAADLFEQNYLGAELADTRLVQEVARASLVQSSQLDQQTSRSLAQIRLIDQLLGQQSDVLRLLEQSSLVDAGAEQSEITDAIRHLRMGNVLPANNNSSVTPITAQAMSSVAYAIAQPSAEVAVRHPWLAAIWHGQAATDLLAATQVKPATDHMQQVIEYLKQTRIRAVRRAALLRLAQAPSLGWLFQSEEQVQNLSAPVLATTLPTTRGVGQSPSLATSPYREELKIYFDALTKAQSERK